MGTSTKINSVAKHLKECNHFSIRGFGADVRVRDPRKCVVFPEQITSLGDQQIYSFPPLTVPKFRSSYCLSCTGNVDVYGTNDSGLPLKRSIVSTNGLNSSSSVIPSRSKQTSQTAIDQEKERNTDIADNAVVENEDISYERCQKDDQRGNAIVENDNINCERPQKDDQRGNAVVVNEDVNGERSQKDDQRVTRSSKKVYPRPFKTYSLRNKRKKEAVVEQLNKSAQHQMPLALTALADAAIEDAEPKATERDSLMISEKPRKVRRLADLDDKTVINTRTEEPSSSRKDSLRGMKRKALPGKSILIRKVSTAGATSDNGVGSDPINGKKKKRVRFQIDEELVQKDVPENDADPSPPSPKRRKKVKLAKGILRTRSATDPSKNTSSGVQPSLNENETVPSPPRDQRTEERVSTSLEYQLASDGCIRNPNPTVASPPRDQRTEERVSTSLENQLASDGCIRNPNPTVASPPRDQRTEERVSTSLEDQLASEGYIRKPNPPVASPPRDHRTEERVSASLDDQLASEGYIRNPTVASPPMDQKTEERVSTSLDNNGVRSRGVVASFVPVFGNPSIPNTGRGLGTGPGAIYYGSSNQNNNQRSSPPSTEVAAQPSLPQKDASVSDRKGKGIMVQSHDNMENTQNDDLPDKEVNVTNNEPRQETPAQRPKTPLPFDLNDTYEDGTSLEEDTNAARTEDPVTPAPVRVEQNSVELLPTRQTYEDGTSLEEDTNAASKEDPVTPVSVRLEQNSVELLPTRQSYMATPVAILPPVQESRRSSVFFPRHNRQRFENMPMPSHYQPPPPSDEALRASHQYIEAPSRPMPSHYQPPPPSDEALRASHQYIEAPSRRRPSHYHLSPSDEVLHAPHQYIEAPSRRRPSHYHQPPPSDQVLRTPVQYIEVTSRQIWTASSVMPPQYHHYNTVPHNMEQERLRMLAQASSSGSNTWNPNFYGANWNQAMMNRMDSRFSSITSPDHSEYIVFTSRHATPVSQLNQVVDQHQRCSRERRVFPRISNQRRGQFQGSSESMRLPLNSIRGRNGESPSNASASSAESFSVSFDSDRNQ